MEPVGWVVLGVLLVVAVTELAPRVHVSAPLLLVLVGVAVSFLPAVPAISVDPRWVLGIVLPPLLYSAAVAMPTMDFRRDLTTISELSVGLVLLSTAVVGVALTHLVPGIGLATGLAVGAVISPTDAVATTIVRRARVSPRLVTVLEGESMLNDATALVLLRSAIAATAATVTLWSVTGRFLWAVVSAVGIGWLVGRVNLSVRARIGHPTVNVAISLVVPFVAYLPTEHLGGSGLVAAVTAGLVTGHDAPKRLRAEDRLNEQAVWRTLELLIESAVFLVMGLQLFGLVRDVRGEHGSLVRALVVGVLAGMLVLVVRSAFVVPSLWLQRRRVRRGMQVRDRLSEAEGQLAARRAAARTQPRPPGMDTEQLAQVQAARRTRLTRVRRLISDIDYLAAESFGWREGVLLVWAGMRGAVTVAAVQSLPASTPSRSTLVLIGFVVAGGTLLLQGGTLPWLVRVLHLSRDPDADLAAERMALHVELVAAVRARLDKPDLRRPDGSPYPDDMLDRARQREAATVADPDLPEDEALEASEQTRAQFRDLRLEILQARRARLLRLRDEGAYSSQSLDQALRVLDAEQIGVEMRGGSAG